ncbi:MAG TPA: sugar phosphate isomerase/epimerase [Candidatus Anammoximicrobium sp.]|nr:sugar phosphate isomerase/epimerase [Candidatus Anammoximicrobium sp.]
MSSSIHRRGFLQTVGAAAGLALVSLHGSRAGAFAPAAGAPHAEKLGWHLGCQAYSFNRYTFFEAVDKTASLGLHYIEAYPGQKMSGEKPDAKIDESLSPELRREVKAKLADCGVRLVNYGVCGLSKDMDASRKTFEFAKDMGIETIVSEPAPDAFDTIEKLCDEYQLNVALHNHPKPSRYWNPDTVLEMCQGRSKRIGACADTGHWMRSELNPVEQLKKLEGRIISFHFKDLNKFGGGAHDVPWGTGAGNVKAMLAEIQRQGIKNAVFSIEYEYNWENSVPEIAQGVAYFDKVAAELAGRA